MKYKALILAMFIFSQSNGQAVDNKPKTISFEEKKDTTVIIKIPMQAYRDFVYSLQQAIDSKKDTQAIMAFLNTYTTLDEQQKKKQ